MSVLFVEGEFFPGADRLAESRDPRFGIGKGSDQLAQPGNIRFKPFENLPLGPFDVSGLLVPVFTVEDDLASVGIRIGDLSPGTDGIIMLLRGVDFHFHRTGIVLIQNILNRVDVMLAHVAQTAAVIIPVSPERAVYAVFVVGLHGSRAEPHVIVKFGGNRFRLQVGFADPVELPVKAGHPADGHFQRPAQCTALHGFLQRLNRGIQPIEIVFEPEPCIQAEHAAGCIDGFHDPFPFTDGSGHGFFTPYVFPCLGSHDRHDAMPVRRSGNVDNVDVGTKQ